MKRQVLLKVIKDVVNVNDVDNINIYAAWSKDNGHVLYLSAVLDNGNTGEEIFITNWIYAERMMDLNYKNESLEKLIEELIQDGYDVFEFENEEDFAEWLLEMYQRA